MRSADRPLACRILLAIAPVLALAAALVPPPAFAAEVPSAEQVDAAVERVLSRPEFQPPAKGLIARMWEEVRVRAVRAFLWILEKIGRGVSAPGVSEIVLVILLVLLVLILVHLAWTLLAYRDPGSSKKEPAAPVTTASLSPEPHLQRAAQLASEGRYLEAAHALYRGVLLWLDGAGRARYEESKTGGEYARELSGTNFVKPFRALLQAFYPLAYGGRPAEPAVYERMREAAKLIGAVE